MMSDLSITNMVLDDFSTDYCNVKTTTGKFPMQKPLFYQSDQKHVKGISLYYNNSLDRQYQ